MDNFFDKTEEAWLRKLKKILASKPEKIILYSTDGDICACKMGVPSGDLARNIAYNIINATNMISDIHE